MSQTNYHRRMPLKYLPTSVLVVWLLFATSARAQDNPLEDPDLQQLLKQAQEMQKNARDLQKSPGSPDTRKKLADMEAMAKEQAAQQEQAEKDEKEKLLRSKFHLPCPSQSSEANNDRGPMRSGVPVCRGTCIPVVLGLPKLLL